MKLTLIYRSKERKEFSIEALFNSLLPYLKKDFDVNEVYLPHGRYNKFSLLRNNYNYVKKFESDIFHITGEVNFVALKKNKEKTIITIHDFVDLEHMKKGPKKIIRKVLWYDLPFKRCKYLVCVSKKTYNDLLKFFPKVKDKAYYIPNPIDDSYNKVEKTFNMIKPRVLAIGTRINKNLERLIIALKDINCELYIVGKLNEEQTKLLKDNNIEYINVYNIDNEEMKKAYINSDILCFCSTYEGFGRPIIESNAIGRVVVTSNIEPMIEVGANAACFVDPYDVESIKDGIKKCINDEKYRNELVLNGYKNAEKYKASRVADEYIKLYKKI